MKTFNNLLKKYLTEYNSKLIINECSVMYEQFVITKKQDAYYVFLDKELWGTENLFMKPNSFVIQ